jgi:hypothetical protein
MKVFFVLTVLTQKSMKRLCRLFSILFNENKKKGDFETGTRYIYPALQRTNTENSKQIFSKKELLGHSPNFHIHVSVSDLYIPTIDLPIPLQDICGVWTFHGNI